MSIGWIMAKRNARHGVATSQLYMGHWTPDFYSERIRIIEEDFKKELRDLYGAEEAAQ